MTSRQQRRAKHEAVVKLQLTVTPEQLEGQTRKSSRSILAPKRLHYSPEPAQSPTKRTKRTNPNKEEDEDGSDDAGLSLYERERLDNIRQNREFLTAINISQATADLNQLTRPKASLRGLVRPRAAFKEVLPARKSLRLQHKEPDTSTLPPEPRGNLIIQDTYTEPKRPSGPLAMEPLNMEEGIKLPQRLLELCSEGSPGERRMELDLKEYRATLQSMTVCEQRVVKVVKERIFSADFHQTACSLLMAAGDKLGHVGLWNMGADWGDDGVLLFQPHTGPVARLAFSSANPAHLLSLSYDGSLRCMDVENAVFHDVYDIPDGLKTFDFLSLDCSTLLVGNWSGEVAVVDRRTPGNSHESLHSLDPKTLRCVSVHPRQRHYVAVAESRTVRIYDTRCLKETSSRPVSELLGHSLSISSAFFSPHTGNRVLTSCLDHRIRVYDTSSMTAECPLLTSIRHNMQTGRWLSKLSAVWDPRREDVFVVGSLCRPRVLQVFHESGRLQHDFLNRHHMTTVQSVAAFHPSRNAVLGGNASGRLLVFSDL